MLTRVNLFLSRTKDRYSKNKRMKPDKKRHQHFIIISMHFERGSVVYGWRDILDV